MPPSGAPGPDMIRLCAPPAAWSAATARRCAPMCKSGKTICGDYIGQVIAQALEMGESNACMKCIVAAPTAGSCGVLPAVLLPYQASEGT